MQAILLVIVLVLALALCAVILMQRSDGGAAALTGGGSNPTGLMSARGASNFLTKTTSWLAAGFMLGCLALTAITRAGDGSSSVIDRVEVAPAEPVEPAAPAVPFSE
jgi:preprotein translocase subunit SecG